MRPLFSLSRASLIFLFFYFVDINAVCVSGVGSSMIKNASSSQKIPLHTILGPDVPTDAFDLINELLVFNPMKRLTAEEALEHHYVSRFHDPAEEIEMQSSVTIPINDDIRLAVDDYRNKLYEIMSSHANSRLRTNYIKHTKSDSVKVDARSRVYRDTEQYLRTHGYTKEKPCNAYSESRLGHLQSKYKNSASNVAADPKLSKHYIMFPDEQQHGISQNRKTSNSYTDTQSRDSRGHRKKVLNSKSNIYMSFNSYNANHGIITQSALMELRAAGTR